MHFIHILIHIFFVYFSLCFPISIFFLSDFSCQTCFAYYSHVYSNSMIFVKLRKLNSTNPECKEKTFKLIFLPSLIVVVYFCYHCCDISCSKVLISFRNLEIKRRTFFVMRDSIFQY